ncbi:MAG: hypothetical protein AAF716_13415 [Cyanobacteria bacterium P01_D01_bin.1]
MTYSGFSLQTAVDQFNIEYLGTRSVFPKVLPSLPPTAKEALNLLTLQLERDVDMARRTPSEKAKSEFVIAPVLATLRQIHTIGVHSGVSFDVSVEENLRGACDFLITLSEELEIIRAPVLVIVEAMRSIMSEGLGQCLAEMIAAQRFNQKANLPPLPVFGCITNGFAWRFLQLSERTVFGDSAVEYSLMPISELMQRLYYTVANNRYGTTETVVPIAT